MTILTMMILTYLVNSGHAQNQFPNVSNVQRLDIPYSYSISKDLSISLDYCRLLTVRIVSMAAGGTEIVTISVERMGDVQLTTLVHTPSHY